MTPNSCLVPLARWLTGRFTFRKRLPKQFGNGRVYVSSRADIRLLSRGLDWAAADLFSVVERCVSPGDCVWDLGSNLGLLSFSAAFAAGPAGKVYSLEADSRYVELQHRTIARLNADYAPIRPLCAAVANRIEILDLAISAKGHARNHLSHIDSLEAGKPELLKQVVVVDCDFLCHHWPAPDFVKIDVEGAEVMVLENADMLLRELRPTLYIEVTPENSEAMTRILKNAGYNLFNFTHTGVETPIDHCTFTTLARPITTT